MKFWVWNMGGRIIRKNCHSIKRALSFWKIDLAFFFKKFGQTSFNSYANNMRVLREKGRAHVKLHPFASFVNWRSDQKFRKFLRKLILEMKAFIFGIDSLKTMLGFNFICFNKLSNGLPNGTRSPLLGKSKA